MDCKADDQKAAQWPRVVAGVVVAVAVVPDFLFNSLWHHSEGDQMKWTDWLLVAVGVLQFGAIMGQVCIYRRQARIMFHQLASMRLAGRTEGRVADFDVLGPIGHQSPAGYREVPAPCPRIVAHDGDGVGGGEVVGRREVGHRLVRG